MRLFGRLCCLIGKHKFAFARWLTHHSSEWRCARSGCHARAVNYREPMGPWVFYGKHPYGDLADGLGSLLESKGRDDGVNQALFMPFREQPSELPKDMKGASPR